MSQADGGNHVGLRGKAGIFSDSCVVLSTCYPPSFPQVLYRFSTKNAHLSTESTFSGAISTRCTHASTRFSTTIHKVIHRYVRAYGRQAIARTRAAYLREQIAAAAHNFSDHAQHFEAKHEIFMAYTEERRHRLQAVRIGEAGAGHVA